MANDTSVNPWVLDTVMGTAYKANVYVSQLIWSNQAAAGDRLTILDASGKTIFDIFAPGANEPVILQPLQWVHGFQITVIGSGKVLVFV